MTQIKKNEIVVESSQQIRKNKVLAASVKRVEVQKKDTDTKMEWTLYTRWANQR